MANNHMPHALVPCMSRNIHMMSSCYLKLNMLEFVCLQSAHTQLDLFAGAGYCPWQQQQWYQDWFVLSRRRSWNRFQVHSCFIAFFCLFFRRDSNRQFQSWFQCNLMQVALLVCANHVQFWHTGLSSLKHHHVLEAAG